MIRRDSYISDYFLLLFSCKLKLYVSVENHILTLLFLLKIDLLLLLLLNLFYFHFLI